MALSGVATWDFGEPLREGWSETPYADVARFKPEAGATILRRRTGRVGATYEGQILLRARGALPTEYARFKTFYNETLQGGVLPFDWTHPFTGVRKTVQFASGSLRERERGGGAVVIRFRLEEIGSE